MYVCADTHQHVCFLHIIAIEMFYICLRCQIRITWHNPHYSDILWTDALNQVIMLKNIILIYIFKPDVIHIFWYVQNMIITHE